MFKNMKNVMLWLQSLAEEYMYRLPQLYCCLYTLPVELGIEFGTTSFPLHLTLGK